MLTVDSAHALPTPKKPPWPPGRGVFFCEIPQLSEGDPDHANFTQRQGRRLYVLPQKAAELQTPLEEEITC
jgi:hypothetical protein